MTFRTLVALMTFGFAALCPGFAAAQEAPAPPASATEPQGFVTEPTLVTRATIFADRHLGKGDLSNGFYVDFGNMIQGAGWLSAGPGYRQWYAKDSVFLDASAKISTKNYRRAQARFELPKVARSRLAFGTQVVWQDFRGVRLFDAGPASHKDSRSNYDLQSKQLAGYTTLRPARWLALEAETSVLRVSPGHATIAPATSHRFLTTGLALTADGRDFPAHPTRGGVLHAAVIRYDDRDLSVFTFKQYKTEAAGFVPIAGGRAVIALHGSTVASQDGTNVPFYLQPSLGGGTTLRSYADYRFRDRNMLFANAELRLAMMTHADLAFFADAGNVAPRFGDLNFDKRSYGGGVRFHTRRQTFAMLDVARGDEGWRLLFRLNDPLALGRLARRMAFVPAAP